MRVGTLEGHAHRYVIERSRRGEIEPGTAQRIGYALASLDRSFGNRPMTQFGQRAIERWLEQNGERWRPSTTATYLGHTKVFCVWLRHRKIIGVDPFADLHAPRRPRPAPRPVPRDEAALLWNALPDARARLIYQLLHGMGMRCCGVARLRMEDIDFVGHTMYVVEKGGHARRLPLMPYVESAIADYLRTSPACTSGPLIRSETRPWASMTPAHIGVLVGRWMRAAGVKRVAFDGRGAHALRHSALTEVAEACADPFTLAELAGWANINTAAFYVRRASTERVRAALEAR